MLLELCCYVLLEILDTDEGTLIRGEPWDCAVFPFPRCNFNTADKLQADILSKLRIITSRAMNRRRMAVMSQAAVFRGCSTSAVIGCYGTAATIPVKSQKVMSLNFLHLRIFFPNHWFTSLCIYLVILLVYFLLRLLYALSLCHFSCTTIQEY